MKEKRSIELMLRVLNSKKVSIGLAPSGSVVIDVSKADDLGSKTWGYIDYLVKSAGYTLTGRAAYSAKYAIKHNEDSKTVKDTFSFPKKEGKWHSYSDIPEFSQHKNGKKFKTSEFTHLQELNHLQEKFNNGVFKKTDAEKLLLFEIKDKIRKGIDSRPFYNEKIWSTEYETVAEIPTNKKMKIFLIDKKLIYVHALALKVERAARNQRKKDAESFEKLKVSGDYVPRVVEVSYTQVKKDGREIKRTKTFNNFPIHPMEDSILTAMQRKAYQTNKFIPNPNYISSRKNPRLVNNAPKYTTRHRNNRFIRVQHRPIPIKALNKRALDFIKEGNNPKLMFNSLGRIDNIYRKTVLKYPKQSHERTYGLK